MKHLWLILFIFIVACNQSPQPTHAEIPTVASNHPTLTTNPSATLTATSTDTATPTNTPLPPTLTPTPTSTPKPITHANIGWEGYGQEPRTPFPDEERIIAEILERNQGNQFFSGITEEDIKVVWHTSEDGTTIWMPYFTMNLSVANNDLFLYVYPLTTDANGNVSLSLGSKALDISAMERTGYLEQLTDIQLVWDSNKNKPVLAIERNGVRLWYPDELTNILVSYDSDISAFGLPPKPEPASDYVVVMDITHIEDAYLFHYDELAVTTMGISDPNAGPVYELNNNQWHAVNPSKFIGGGSPQIAYIGYDTEGNGHLYIEELTNWQTGISISSNIHTPLAPAYIIYDQVLSNINSSDFYYVLTTPVWSPDGRRVAFIAEENEKPVLAVYDLDTQTWKTLTQIPTNPMDRFEAPVWSPDGDWLVYGYGFTGASFARLKTVSYPEGIVHEIDQGGNPQWVQDDNGLRLNYQKHMGEYFMATPDGSIIEPMTFSIQLKDLTRPSTGYGLILWYYPDDNAFLVFHYKQEDGLDKLLYVPADGSKPRILAQYPEQDGNYSYDYYNAIDRSSIFSPDGKWLLLYARTQDGQGKTALLNLKTQEIKLFDRGLNFMAGWTSDSRGIIHRIFGPTVTDILTGEYAYFAQVFPLRIATPPWGGTGDLYWPTK